MPKQQDDIDRMDRAELLRRLDRIARWEPSGKEIVKAKNAAVRIGKHLAGPDGDQWIGAARKFLHSLAKNTT